MSELLKYQRLSELEHVRKRSSVYIGAITNTQRDCWVVDDAQSRMVNKTLDYNPGLQKLFDEIISNSVDEHIRTGAVKNIWVTIHEDTGEIVVKDDGGIPVKQHPEYNLWIPEMIFSELRAGSNFDDTDRSTAGTNGMGSCLVNMLSSRFKVETADGTNRFVQVFSNGMQERTEALVTPTAGKGTTISFIPDYDFFNCKLDAGNITKIVKRVYDVAGCNPNIKVHLNKNVVKCHSFKQFVEMFTDKFVHEATDDFEVAVAVSPDESFQHVSFVNGIDTYNGGNHIDYVVGQIVTKVREFIKKKHKIDVKPNTIKQQLFVLMKCRINAPMFTSQTKEFMSSEIRNFGTQYTPSDKFIKKILESEVVQKVLDWVESEKHRENLAELRKLNRTTQSNNFLKRIAKFDDANGKIRKNCMLLLTEGDSASRPIVSSRDAKKHGVFPLKGKPLNVRDIDVKKLVANEEFQNIMSILGLKIGHQVKDVDDLRFGKICIVSDQDLDGFHVSGLFFNMMWTFWPELFKMGIVHRMRTPLVIATHKKTQYEFFTEKEYHEWAEQHPGHKFKYYKGLGSFGSVDFKRFLDDEDRYLMKITVVDETDSEYLDIAFDKSRADDRKEWLLETTPKTFGATNGN